MREIKFRGMSADGVMRYGKLAQDRENSTAYYDESSQRILLDEHSNIPISNESLGQFTGLLDKNGKEMYEGDIVRHNNSNSLDVITFLCGGFTISSIDDLEHYHDDFAMSKSHGKNEYEVIGNLHENPELLKEKY